MQLIERYIEAVKFWLPGAQQEDIAAELHANLIAQAEDKEAELGRPLNQDDEAAILKQVGAPALVAARYRQDRRTVTIGQQLIGPVVFPFYWVAVKATLCILAVLGVVTAATLAFHGDGSLGRQIAQAAGRLPGLALPALLIVTLVFAGLDYAATKFRVFEDWDPRTLPPLDQKIRKVPRATSIAGIVVQIVFIIWWLGLPNFSGRLLGQLPLAPIWQTLYLPALLIAVAILAQHVGTLLRPRWTWLPPAIGLATSIAALVVIYPFLETQALVLLPAESSTPLVQLKVGKLNYGLHLSIVWIWIGILIAAVVDAVRCVLRARDFMAANVASPSERIVNGSAG